MPGKSVQGSIKNKVTATELVEERAKGQQFDKHEMTMAFYRYDWVYKGMQNDFDLMEKHPIMANTH